MDFLSCFDFNKQTSLYVHIPFCSKKCSYCAFYSCPGADEDLKERFTDKLVKEIEVLTSNMKGPFYTAFIGGGNPGMLSVKQLERISSAVCKNGRPVEFTTEMNPENLSNEHFGLFDGMLNRLSMGVQSLDSKALEFLGRNSTLEQTLKGLELSLLLKDKTKASVSYDLISCLGKFHSDMDDVQKIISRYKPDHLSVYALTLEEGTKLYNSKVSIPDSDEQYEILQELWLYLEEQGYNHYEVSNFAKPGKKSLHNSVYWNYQQYVGLGPASCSTGFVNGFAYRLDFPKNVKAYNQSDLLSDFGFEKLDKEEQLEEFVIMGLRHKDGLDLKRLSDDFNKEIRSLPYGYSIEDNRLVPDDRGLMLADSAADFLLDNI